MFCEVLLCSRKREFYKREGKSNVKDDAKKTEKRAERQKYGKETGGNISQGIRSLYVIIFTTIFHILQIWMWT